MITFNNTSNKHQFTARIETSFWECVHDEFKRGLEEKKFEPISVRLVSEVVLDKYRKEYSDITEVENPVEFHPDLFGVYIPHHKSDHKSEHEKLILVSPDKIWDFAKDFHAQCLNFSKEKIYHTLLIKVVIHELSHLLMDPYVKLSDACKNIHSNAECTYFSESDRGDLNHKSQEYRHIVEESLANALARKNNWTQDQEAIVTSFIKVQPTAYRAGLKYDMTLTRLMRIAESWSLFKQRYMNKELYWVHTESPSPLRNFTNRLLDVAAEPVTNKPEFFDTFFDDDALDAIRTTDTAIMSNRMRNGNALEKFLILSNPKARLVEHILGYKDENHHVKTRAGDLLKQYKFIRR